MKTINFNLIRPKSVFFMLAMSAVVLLSCSKSTQPKKELGYIYGTVTAVGTGTPIVGVVTNCGGKSNTTNQSGEYEIRDITAGTHEITASRSDYETYSASVNVSTSGTRHNISMTANWQPSSEFYVTFKLGNERIEFNFADIDVDSSDNEFEVNSGPSTSSDWDEVFEIENAPLSVGTFDLGDGFVLKYIPDGDENNYTSKYRAGTSFPGSTGQLIVSRIDGSEGVIEGQFSGKLKLQEGQGSEYIEMTDGIFKGKMRD